MKDLIAKLRIPGDRVMSTRECWQIADALEALLSAPKCGRCGKHQIADVHTCTPTEWAKKMEAEIGALLDRWDDLLEMCELHGLHDDPTYQRSKAALAARRK